MKLFICKECLDIQLMQVGINRECKCGKSWGLYNPEDATITENKDGRNIVSFENVTVGGEARVFGIGNGSFSLAGIGTLATFEGWFYDTGFIETKSIKHEEEVDDELTGTTDAPD